jgi:hypothetical protein
MLSHAKHPSDSETDFDTEVTEASRRAQSSTPEQTPLSFTQNVNPDFSRPDSRVFLCELPFVLCGLCDEIGPPIHFTADYSDGTDNDPKRMALSATICVICG